MSEMAMINNSACTLFLFLLLFCGMLFSCKKAEQGVVESTWIFTEIDSLIRQKDYFTAREQYRKNRKNLSTFQLLTLGVFLDNAFNRPNVSAGKAEKIFRDHANVLNDTLAMRIKSITLNNYIRLYEYKKAKDITEDLLSNYKQVMTAENIKDYKNMLIIWNALQEQPKQEVHIPRETDLEIIPDAAGLKTLEIKKGSSSANFIFDTGANFSTITESTAKLFQLNLLEGQFEVTSITGDKILSRVAIAPQLKLGTIIIKNAVFLVFPDAALAFPQIDNQIFGIIGFPVIEALNEIQITSNNRFIVPKTPSRELEENLAFDFLTPLLLLKDKKGKGIYTFDPGADRTMLYSTYFKKYLQDDTSSMHKVMHKFGGAGGESLKNGYYVSFFPEVHGIPLKIDSVMVIKDPIDPGNLYLGNLGQDFLGKFSKMTVNFDQMFMRFD